MSIAEKYRPHYTYDDYVEWEGRWELIEGMPYAMSPLPVPEHQRISLNLCILFKEGLKDCKQCKVYPPIDWKIAEDTVVQPGVLIVCNKIEKKYLDFPPVLVAEILSPSTAAKDRGLKMELYRMQKVKYYCLIDWQFKKIEIYELLTDSYQPVSVNPDGFQFLLNTCTADVNFESVWE
jgi:Uma2 family endonuclease